MAKSNLQSPPTTGGLRMIALCVFGAVVVVAGTLLPRFMNLPNLGSGAIGERTSVRVPEGVPDWAIPAKSETPSTAFSPELLPPALRPIVDRALIIGSILVLAVGLGWWFMKRSRMNAAPTIQGVMNVTATLSLPHGCCAYLLTVGDRQFFAGVDAMGIKSLIPLPAPAIDDGPALETPVDVAPPRLEIRA